MCGSDFSTLSHVGVCESIDCDSLGRTVRGRVAGGGLDIRVVLLISCLGGARMQRQGGAKYRPGIRVGPDHCLFVVGCNDHCVHQNVVSYSEKSTYTSGDFRGFCFRVK